MSAPILRRFANQLEDGPKARHLKFRLCLVSLKGSPKIIRSCSLR